MPATSQLDWLISMTAMIVLFWSRATRDLLKSFGWGIAALHRENAATKLPFLAARPIASLGPARSPASRWREADSNSRSHCGKSGRVLVHQVISGISGEAERRSQKGPSSRKTKAD